MPVQTLSGRRVLPPKLVVKSTERAITLNLQRIDSWLHREALHEANCRHDNHALTLFIALVGMKFSPSDRDALNHYLFGRDAITFGPERKDGSA